MAHTVVGFFDNYSEAQEAVEELKNSGIDSGNIDLSNGTSTGNVSGSTYSQGDNKSEKSGIAKFFDNLFGNESDDSRKYSTIGESASAIVTVHVSTEDEAEEAADILDDAGAINVDERASQYGYAATGSATGTERGADLTGKNSDKIDRIEEELQVGKRTVETGGVRIRSRIVERPIEENIRLREEHVRVERQPVNRTLSGGDLDAFQEREIEMTERSEVPVVNKEARVVEEIRVSKDVDERDETIRDTVRHTEVDIDDTDSSNKSRPNLRTDTDDDDFNTGSSELNR